MLSPTPTAAATPLCWLDGAIMPAGEARISVLDHGLLYGDGVFEGIRLYGRQPFQLQAHLQRLFASARALALTIPYSEMELANAIQSLAERWAPHQGYIRLVVTRGVGTMGIDPNRCKVPTVFIILDHLAVVSETVRQAGANVVIASTRRIPSDCLDARIKSLNYLNNILAKMEANRAGADEAILLNHLGRVAEGSAENVFVVKNGRLSTPSPLDGALAGITRQVVLDLAAQLGIPAVEQALTPYDLYNADECFLTGTGAELIPVRSVDQRQIQACPGAVFLALDQAFRELTLRRD